MDKSTEKLIVEAEEKLYKEILRKEVPVLDFPMRSLENVTYDKKKGPGRMPLSKCSKWESASNSKPSPSTA